MEHATMPFNKVRPTHMDRLREIAGPAAVWADSATLEHYGHDWTEDLRFLPEVLVKPQTTQEVAQVAQLCNAENLPLTPCGARTGLSGGMLPVYGGVLLSVERMNEIVALDTRNQQITVQAGVVNQHIQDAAEAAGLMYAPDPSSKQSCLIGGNLAENAGGAHAVKYGITKDFVLALEAVTGAGQIIRTGAKVLKNSTGYNLTQLLVGSEGTLAIITEATLKLLPKPKHDVVMLIPFAEAEKACEAVSALFQAGISPSALEFMEVDAIAFGQAFLGVDWYETDGLGGHLLLELDGNDMQALHQESELAAAVVERFGAQDILFADEPAKKADLWRLRRCLGEAVKGGKNIYKEEDTVVPRAELAKLLAKVKAVGAQYGFRSVCYGHAGDGNLHVNILKDDMPAEKWETVVPQAVTEIFEYTVKLGGTLSGEHGIGWVQKRYMPIAFQPHELALMRGIKQVFDPKGILNPGKIFPDCPMLP